LLDNSLAFSPQPSVDGAAPQPACFFPPWRPHDLHETILRPVRRLEFTRRDRSPRGLQQEGGNGGGRAGTGGVGNGVGSGLRRAAEDRFAYVGPVGDGGWTFAHDRGRKALEKEFGARIQTSFVENVPEAADAERVFRDLASQGNTLVFGTTFGYMEPMLKVAADHKNVRFEHATGYKQAENLRTYDTRTYEGAYMAGVIAGGMTKTNTLGWSARSRSRKSSATSTASPSARSR
jgi:hypothetical protein